MKKSDVKLRTHKKNKVTTADYFNVIDKSTFRLYALKSLFKEYKEITLVVDTNQRITDQDNEAIIAGLKSFGIEPYETLIPANPSNILGFQYVSRNARHREKLIIFQIAPQKLTPGLFEVLSGYDMAVCAGSQKPLEEIFEVLRLDGIGAAPDLFDIVCYDSVVCSCMRCTFEAGNTIKELTDEMGI